MNRVVAQVGSSGGFLTGIDLPVDRQTGDAVNKQFANVRVVKVDVETDLARMTLVP